MWRGAARQIRYRRLNQREQAIVQFRVCGSRRSSSIYASLSEYGRPEPAELNRLFNGNGSLLQIGNRQSCAVPGAVEESVSSWDAPLNGAVHLPWFSNQLRRMLPPEATGRERLGFAGGSSQADPPWSPRVKAFASTAEAVEEDVATTDVEEDASTSEEFQSNFEDGRSRQPGGEQNRRELAPRNESGRNDREAMRRMQKNKYRALRRRQMKTETEAWQQAAKEYRELMMEMCQQKLAPNLPYMKSLFLGWFEPLRDVIAAEQVEQGNRRCKTSYGESLRQLPADMLAVITMHKLMGLLMTGQDGGCARVVQAAVQIGEAVEHEIRIHKFLEKTKKKPKRRKKINEEEEETVTKEQQVLRKRVTDLMKKQKVRQVRQLVKGKDDSNPWGRALHAQVGSRLIELLIQTAYIQPPVDQSAESPPEIRPAFKHTLRTETIGQKIVKRYGAIECDPMVSRGLDRTARHMVIPYMPMLVPPTRWTGYDRGGYLFLPSYIMRTHGAKQQREAMKRVPRNQIQKVYDALDTLGSTRWRVNKRVLDVVDRIWSGGGLLADLVDREDVPIPEMPDTNDETDIKHWKWSVKKAKKINSERHSQRCDTELKLAVARKMKDEECFFYPHNLDFRGRAYPMHPYLNHLGSDMCRGILEFAEGRPLGKTGLTWLKIHLANLFAGGVDKLSFDGRLTFVEDNINNIIDSAERPLEGKRWWLGAEDPFQCLSACMNLRDVLKSSSQESVICHMPVHQDGSCNGLQHYAALGRDRLGAAAVNLIQGDKPADVYSGIAARVDAIMQRDALKDPATNPNAVSARLLLGQVDRKLVKQTVMTSVYGVTYIGARDQIRKRLKERGCIADEVALYNAACYAARTTLTALGEMFNAARSIMSWLGECAKVIASENEPVRWITPLGLPVVQPYRKYARQLVRTSLQVLALQHESDAVMVNRQRTAFPPNFVHSLDGSHMMMTAVTCKKAGLTFAGVHDSYWTHACDVDKMNQILREKFVELYSKPILENLLQGFESSFPNLSFPPLPDRSDFDLKEVLNSPYFFN